ncbi:hypothetical protein N9S61_00050 [Alphaproteobacteria bacterium]|jgi:uncharacterized protein (DUF1330 family)|nr:hypothetical protein [Alphaproteobacteria bacterium]
MLVLGQIKLIKDFQEWKKMVQENGDKLKEYGMTFIFAGTQANDNTILNTVMHFQSKEDLQKFQSDEELTKRRAEVVDVNSAVMTPISDTAFTNFPQPLTLGGN